MKPMVLALALLVAGAAGADEPRRSLAVMVGAPPAPESPRLEAARAALAKTYQLSERPGLRGLLEGFARPPSVEERVRAALDRAHAKLRRFELAAVREALAEAAGAAAELPPTSEGRALAAEVAVRT